MKKLFFILFLALSLTFPVNAQELTRGRTIFEEEDGSPSVVPYKVKVSNTTLTDNADGTVSLAIGSGDITSVGDATSGAAFDGTSDGGTYLDFYDDGGAERFKWDASANDFDFADDINISDTDPHIQLIPTVGDAFEFYGFANELYCTNVTDSKVLWRINTQNQIQFYNQAGFIFPDGAPTNNQILKYDVALARLAWEADAGGGAPTDADYLVGTANDSLSAEIVAGTAPGGELGGTWASPTIDDSVAVSSWNLTTPTITTSLTTSTPTTLTAAELDRLDGLTSAIIDDDKIDTYSELNTIVADVTLTHNGLIDTSAELLAIVGDETGTGLLTFATSPTFTTKIISPEVENAGNITIDAINAAAASTVAIQNSDATYTANLTIDGDLTITGGDITLGTTSIFSGGDTASLNNIDAIDGTTETTLEAAIDALSNLVTTGTITTGGWNVADSVTRESVYTSTTSLEETTGATDSGGYIVGLFDEFAFSAGTDVQTVLDDLDNSIPDNYQYTLLPESSVLDDNNPPAITVVESSGTATPRFRVADFDGGSTNEIIYWSLAIPDDYNSSGTITADVYWFTAGTSGNARWGIQVSSTTEADTTAITAQAADSENGAQEAANGTANRLVVTTVTLTNNDTLAAGDDCVIVFYRDASDTTNDTLTNDARLLKVLLKIPRT